MTPQIELAGVLISEPTTLVTDYVVAIVSLSFAARLFFRSAHSPHRSRQLWAAGFFLVGCGLILGGTAHGFALYMNERTLVAIWKVVFYAAGLSMAAMIGGTVVGLVPSRNARKLLHGVNAIGLLAFAAFVAGSDGNFLLVIIDSVVSLAAIALVSAWAAITQRSRGAVWLVAGVLVYVLSAAIQQSRIDLHAFFNHNDLYHVVLLVSLCLLYRGVTLTTEQKRGTG